MELCATRGVGTFIVREYVPLNSKYALSVVYNGVTTHHLVTAPDGKQATVGGATRSNAAVGEMKLPVHVRILL